MRRVLQDDDFMGAFRKLQHAYRQYGLIGIFRLIGRALTGCCKYLRYEPVLTLAQIYPVNEFDSGRTRIAIHIHIFYPELAEELIRYSNNIPYHFDCYVSTDSCEKADVLNRAFCAHSRACKVEIGVYPNQGRDVAPFIWQMTPHIREYEYICHIHGKGSMHDSFGDKWRKYLLDSVLYSAGFTAAIINQFEHDFTLGLIFQRTYWRLKPYVGWRGNRHSAKALFKRMGLNVRMPLIPQFSAGDMFWARMEAIIPIFEAGLMLEDFSIESGQVEGTMAHCLERCWGCVAQARGYGIRRVCNRMRG